MNHLNQEDPMKYQAVFENASLSTGFSFPHGVMPSGDRGPTARPTGREE